MCMTTTVSYTARCYAELHKNTEEMNWRKLATASMDSTDDRV